MDRGAAKEKVIVALDVPSAADALALVDELAQEVGWFKVGLELFIAEGPALVRQIAARAPVFLDLKLHDIPATVGRATGRSAALGARLLSVHVDDGGAFEQAVATAAPHGLGIVGISVLTSVSEDALARSGDTRTLRDLVSRRARRVATAGAAGLVCSGLEAAEVRAILGQEALVVTPGVRLAAGARGDQKRVVTPAEAITNGASHVVVGRPIRDARSPRAAAAAIVDTIASVL